MTADELAALVEGIAPVVRDVVRTTVADLAGSLRERIAVLETRASAAEQRVLELEAQRATRDVTP